METDKSSKDGEDDNRSGDIKGKSYKGTLYYSSVLKSKDRTPRCFGLRGTLQPVPRYLVGQSEVEASKEGRSLTDFRYVCVGYSVYLENKETYMTQIIAKFCETQHLDQSRVAKISYEVLKSSTSQFSSGLGTVPIEQVDNKSLIEAHRVVERERLSKKLDKHLQFCTQNGVKALLIYIEMDSIPDGIVKLIHDKKIGKLVMGAAADKRLSKLDDPVM